MRISQDEDISPCNPLPSYMQQDCCGIATLSQAYHSYEWVLLTCEFIFPWVLAWKPVKIWIIAQAGIVALF